LLVFNLLYKQLTRQQRKTPELILTTLASIPRQSRAACSDHPTYAPKLCRATKFRLLAVEAFVTILCGEWYKSDALPLHAAAIFSDTREL